MYTYTHTSNIVNNFFCHPFELPTVSAVLETRGTLSFSFVSARMAIKLMSGINDTTIINGISNQKLTENDSM